MNPYFCMGFGKQIIDTNHIDWCRTVSKKLMFTSPLTNKLMRIFDIVDTCFLPGHSEGAWWVLNLCRAPTLSSYPWTGQPGPATVPGSVVHYRYSVVYMYSVVYSVVYNMYNVLHVQCGVLQAQYSALQTQCSVMYYRQCSVLQAV